jgi:hypothetical protein
MIRIFLTLLLLLKFSLSILAQEMSFSNNDEEKHPLCGGVERWDVKVLTDPQANLVNLVPRHTTIDSLINIPTTPDPNAGRVEGIEFQTYVLNCNIIIKKNEDDNDYHLVLKSGTVTLVGEVPDPVCATAASSSHVNEYIAARNWVNSYIGIYPNSNVVLAPVEITGVAFVDVPHGQTGAAPNQMEIHPILKIQFASHAGTIEANNTPIIKVSVNPSVFSERTTFHISSQNELFEKCRLEIYSASGNRVRNIEVPVTNKKETVYTFNRDGLSTGPYIYRILSNRAIVWEGKFIIQ